jgi:hypothetical protein
MIEGFLVLLGAVSMLIAGFELTRVLIVRKFVLKLQALQA